MPESVVGRAAHPNHRPELLDRGSHGVAANTGEDISQLNLADEGKAGKHHHPDKDPCPPCNIGQPTPVAMSDPDAEPMELRSQIQLYATNEYVSHCCT
jgi:hypothetical protein